MPQHQLYITKEDKQFMVNCWTYTGKRISPPQQKWLRICYMFPGRIENYHVKISCDGENIKNNTNTVIKYLGRIVLNVHCEIDEEKNIIRLKAPMMIGKKYIFMLTNTCGRD
jgi:hypothetical protein